MQDSELQFSLEGQKTNYYVNIHDHKDLTFIVQNKANTRKAKFRIEITSTLHINIEPNSIYGKIKSGKSKSYQISLWPEELGVYTISVTFLSHLVGEEKVSVQLTVIDCFSDINPLHDFSLAMYSILDLTGSEFVGNEVLSEYYSNPENFDIFIIELEYVLALLHLVLGLDKKYNGLFSSQIKDYLEDLITKVTQFKTRIVNKEKFYLDTEFEYLFDIEDSRVISLGHSEHPLKDILEDLRT